MIYSEVQPEIKLKLFMYEAVYTVTALKKSNLYEDVFFSQKLRDYYNQNTLYVREFVRMFDRTKTLPYQFLEI